MLYLDMIKQQPMNLHDRFTEMHRMNLHVQNAMDQLEQKVNDFLMNVKKNKPEIERRTNNVNQKQLL